MRVVARGTFHFCHASRVIQANFVGVRPGVAIGIEKFHGAECRRGRLEIDIRSRGRIAYADGMIVSQVCSDHKCRKVRRARTHERTRCVAGQASDIIHAHVGARSDSARIGPRVQKSIVLAGRLRRLIPAGPRHIDDGVHRRLPVVTGKTGQRVGAGLRDRLGNGTRSRRTVSGIGRRLDRPVPQWHLGRTRAVGRVAVHADFAVVGAILIHGYAGRSATAELALRQIMSGISNAALIAEFGGEIDIRPRQ